MRWGMRQSVWIAWGWLLLCTGTAFASPKSLGTELEQYPNPNNLSGPTVSLSAPATTMVANTTGTFSLTGSSDADGDPLFYFWRVSGGTFAGWSGNYQSMTWKAPLVSTAQTFWIVGSVGDGAGHVTSKSVMVTVTPTDTPPNGEGDGGCPLLPAPKIVQLDVFQDMYRVEWEEVEGETSYLFQEDTDANFGSPRELSFQANRQFELIDQAVNGTYYLRMRAVNDCGPSAWSPTVSVVMNTNHYPTQPIAITPTPNQTNVARDATLCWESTHPEGQPLTYQLYLLQSDGPYFYNSNLVYTGSATCFKPTTLLAWGKPYMWEVIVTDSDGSEVTSPIFRFTVVPDVTPPTGSVQIEGGAATTNSYSVTLSITANDTESGVLYMSLSNNGTAWTSWDYLNPTRLWDLRDSLYGGYTKADGKYTVYLRLRDAESNVSSSYTATITKVEGAPGIVTLKGKTYESLQQAIETATAGDTVFLSPGEWKLPASSLPLHGGTKAIHLNLKAGVHLVGAGWEKTRLVTTTTGYGVVMQPGSTMTGITVDNNTGRGAVVPRGNNLIRYCRLSGAGGNGFGGSGVYIQDSDLPVSTVRHSLIDHNYEGITVAGNSALKVVHSVVVSNDTGMRWNYAHPDSLVRNTIAAFVTQYCNVTGPSEILGQLAFQSNNVYAEGNASGCFNPNGQNGNISADPLFVNALAKDYRLQSGSPLINTGSVIDGLTYTGAAPDIGAYEYSATGTLTVNAGHPNASFVLSGPAEYNGSGATWSAANAPIGMYTLAYFPVSDWNTPLTTTFVLEPNQNQSFDTTYTQDLEGPTGTLEINLQEYATAHPEVLLRLDVKDAVAGMDASSQMQFSNDGVTWSTPEPFAAVVRSWDLRTTGGGTVTGARTVYARVSDRLGNWSTPLTDTISYLPTRTILEVPTHYATAESALAAAQPGDVVWLLPGEHNQKFTQEAKTLRVPSGVRLQGSGPTATTLHARVQLQTNAQVDGMTLDYGSPAITMNNAPGSIVSNARVVDIYQSLDLNGNTPGDVFIRNTLFRHNCCARAIMLWGSLRGHFDNNVVTGMDEAIYSDYTHGPATFRHNIFTNLEWLFWAQNPGLDQPTKIFFDTNAIWDVTGMYEYGNSVGLSISKLTTVDPLFVDPASLDYRLQSASPLLHGGTPDPLYQDWSGEANTLGLDGGLGVNTPPLAALQSTIDANAGTVTLDAGLSTDAQDAATQLETRWDLDGDGTYDTPWETTLTKTTPLSQGTHTVTLQVRDRSFYLDTVQHDVVMPNAPPTAPTTPTPAHQLILVPLNQLFSWSSTDADGDALTYDLSLGAADGPLLPIALGLTEPNWTPPSGQLAYGQHYQWQILARDADGVTTFGPVWEFFTEPDPDSDGDGLSNGQDNCPTVSNPDQSNLDGDGTGDVCDLDDDGDGQADAQDNCPLIPNADQLNTDADALGNACDSDDDNDGVEDANDAFPQDANESKDTDGDGIGENTDLDDDGDTIPDLDDACPTTANDQAGDPCNPNDGHRWLLNENFGCQAASTTDGKNGVLAPDCEDQGPQWSDGLEESGLSFDGANDFVQTNLAYTNGPLTISAWYQSNDRVTNRMALLGGNTGGRFELYVHAGRPGCRVWDTADRSIYMDTQPDTGWHHIACVQTDGATPSTTLYVDGIARKSTPYVSKSLGGSWYFGKSGSTIANRFNGRLDVIEFWPRALSAEEVQGVYATWSALVQTPPPYTWSFDAGVGCTASDTGQAAHGTLQPTCPANAPQWTSGVKGYGLSFDGLDDRVTTPLLYTTGPLTVSGWFKTSTLNVRRMTMVGGNNGGRFEVYVDSGRPGCRVWDTTERSIFAPTSVGTGWHHVACVQNTQPTPSTIVYVDGQAVATTPYASVSAGGSWGIGRSGSSSANYFSGLIDEVKIWPSAQSATAIAAEFAAYQPPDDDAIAPATWHLNEGVGCTTVEASGLKGSLGPTCPTNAPTWSTGKFQGGLQFDGNDFVQTPLAFTNQSAVSLTAWYQTNVVNNSPRLTVVGGNNGGRLEMYVWSGRPGCRVWDTADHTIFAPTPSDANWHHVACVQTTSPTPSTTLYVDGQLVASTPHVSVSAGGTWGIGRTGSTAASHFIGTIDEVKIWSKALTAEDVTAEFTTVP